MLPKEVIKKIRKIEIRTKKLVNDVFSGEYHSIFKGRGMEFQEVREYQPGDDIRIIDWNVTARYGFPFVKKFQEERELTVVILLDASSSGKFGTQEKMKSELAAEICSLLAFSAIKNNDKVGMIIFTDQIEKYIPPQKGSSHVLRLIREVLYYQPQSKGTDLALALDFLGRIQNRRAVVFIISDFLSADYDKPLKIVNRRHDVIAIRITDPRETEMPAVGFIELEDAETGEQILVDTSDFLVRKQFNMFANSEREKLSKKFQSMNLDSVEVLTDRSYIIPLMTFFKQRAKKLR
ncbi:MAG: hypothetical protein A2145_07130 [candidate division Zixibacteria bacterium RBG_16_40_9]|nr:MAG: hypothetical protein A2145_07130 [candidate division Zixibacteria bacterium RBG_16_40_9]